MTDTHKDGALEALEQEADRLRDQVHNAHAAAAEFREHYGKAQRAHTEAWRRLSDVRAALRVLRGQHVVQNPLSAMGHPTGSYQHVHDLLSGAVVTKGPRVPDGAGESPGEAPGAPESAQDGADGAEEPPAGERGGVGSGTEKPHSGELPERVTDGQGMEWWRGDVMTDNTWVDHPTLAPDHPMRRVYFPVRQETKAGHRLEWIEQEWGLADGNA